MKTTINSVTGLPRVSFEGKLLNNLSTEVFTNTNGKKYKLATIQYKTIKGEVKQTSAMVYEGNYAHENANFVIGNTYLATATVVESGKDPIITLSHLTANERASASDFGLVEATVENMSTASA